MRAHGGSVAIATRGSRSRFNFVPFRSIRPLLCALLVAVLESTAICAQREPVLKRESHIEVVSRRLPGGIGVGWLVELTADSLTFVDTTAERTLALADIGQLRVNIGRDRAAMNIATMAGAVFGAFLEDVISPESRECRYELEGSDECSHEVPPKLVAALFGAGGFRMLTRYTLDDRWVNVNLQRLLDGGTD